MSHAQAEHMWVCGRGTGCVPAVWVGGAAVLARAKQPQPGNICWQGVRSWPLSRYRLCGRSQMAGNALLAGGTRSPSAPILADR